MLVVKIGGAVASHKDQYCTPNLPALHELGKVLRAHWSDLAGRLVVVLGGGSFGHGISERYHLEDSSQPWERLDLSRTTLGMLEWLSIVARAFREEGVPCHPFQTSSYLVTQDGRPRAVLLDPIRHALALGVLPLLSGDLVFDASKTFVIFSSDWIPGLLARELPIRRVVMLTDVEGVRERPSDAATRIARVAWHERARVLLAAGPSRQRDISGGMRTKVEALLRLADIGVESVICDGRTPENLIPALFDAAPPGTLIEARRRPSAAPHEEAIPCSSPLPAAMVPARARR